VVSDVADPAWITQVLARRRLFVSELTPLAANLESVFLELTGTTPVPERSEPPEAPVTPPATQPADRDGESA
jgi:ABC-2 type transport system ATP-binding protein